MDIISESCIRKNGHFTDKDICLERSAGVFAIPKKYRAGNKTKDPDIEKEAQHAATNEKSSETFVSKLL